MIDCCRITPRKFHTNWCLLDIDWIANATDWLCPFLDGCCLGGGLIIGLILEWVISTPGCHKGDKFESPFTSLATVLIIIAWCSETMSYRFPFLPISGILPKIEDYNYIWNSFWNQLRFFSLPEFYDYMKLGKNYIPKLGIYNFII